jgi:hypothetical protein
VRLDGVRAKRLAKIQKAGVLVTVRPTHSDRVLKLLGLVNWTEELVIKYPGQPGVIRAYIYPNRQVRGPRRARHDHSPDESRVRGSHAR